MKTEIEVSNKMERNSVNMTYAFQVLTVKTHYILLSHLVLEDLSVIIQPQVMQQVRMGLYMP